MDDLIVMQGFTFEQNMALVKQWYEYRSGLQAMQMQNERELERIRLANARKIAEAQQGNQR